MILPEYPYYRLSVATNVRMYSSIALKLNAIQHAKDVVHLTAADEHRKKFSLTDIRSAGGKGREICLPGVHADIGGSYRDGPGEDPWVFWKKNIFSAGKQVDAEKARLVAAIDPLTIVPISPPRTPL